MKVRGIFLTPISEGPLPFQIAVTVHRAMLESRRWDLPPVDASENALLYIAIVESTGGEIGIEDVIADWLVEEGCPVEIVEKMRKTFGKST